MGIIDRLGNVIRSYLNDEDRPFRGEDRKPDDPDLRSAYEELDEFLKGKPRRDENSPGEGGGRDGGEKSSAQNPPPESLRPDFAELGLPLGAGEEECKAAYKRLLKIHHPDRHAGHRGNMEKATKKAARINTAYDRIGAWRAGKI
jgi:DnaJ-domain-containing protein 1